MRLTDEKIADIKEYLNRSIKVTASSLIPQLSKYGIDLIDTIEAQQQEIERLNKALDDWKYIAKCDADHIAALTADKDELAKVLKQAREAIKAAWGDGSANAAMDKASEALTAIDKVIGGKEDV